MSHFFFGSDIFFTTLGRSRDRKKAGEIVEILQNQNDRRQIAPSRSPLKNLRVYGSGCRATAKGLWTNYRVRGWHCCHPLTRYQRVMIIGGLVEKTRAVFFRLQTLRRKIRRREDQNTETIKKTCLRLVSGSTLSWRWKCCQASESCRRLSVRFSSITRVTPSSGGLPGFALAMPILGKRCRRRASINTCPIHRAARGLAPRPGGVDQDETADCQESAASAGRRRYGRERRRPSANADPLS
jgi:hypothetical protein